MSISTLDASLRLPLLSAFKLFWLILLMVVGVLAAKRNMKELLLCYLLALYRFSISLFDEYLVIPMLVCSIFYKSWASWAFMLSSAAVMVTREAYDVALVHPFLHNLPWQYIRQLLYPPLVFASQSCIIVLLMLRWRDRFGPETGLQTSAMTP